MIRSLFLPASIALLGSAISIEIGPVLGTVLTAGINALAAAFVAMAARKMLTTTPKRTRKPKADSSNRANS